MVTAQQVATFWRSAASAKLKDVPAISREHFGAVDWKGNFARTKHAYKKSLDEGGAMPLVQFIGGLFAFNYILSLPKEMAHVAHEEQQRFGH